jgi:SnoaL-like domain
MTFGATMQAERACERLVLDYAAFNDAGDWNKVAALYIETGRMSRPTAPDVFITGRDAILAAFLARPARVTRHIVTNIRVDLPSKSDALVSSHILLFTGADQPPLVGSYADKCVLTPEGWRFSERRGSLDFLKT